MILRGASSGWCTRRHLILRVTGFEGSNQRFQIVRLSIALHHIVHWRIYLQT